MSTALQRLQYSWLPLKSDFYFVCLRQNPASQPQNNIYNTYFHLNCYIWSRGIRPPLNHCSFFFRFSQSAALPFFSTWIPDWNWSVALVTLTQLSTGRHMIGWYVSSFQNCLTRWVRSQKRRSDDSFLGRCFDTCSVRAGILMWPEPDWGTETFHTSCTKIL